ncbi:MAG TPA: putative zinc-binding protein, partial [Aliidiomarina sp.]|nr:putative zinc-binding protein [Aliidiomarina sp.]
DGCPLNCVKESLKRHNVEPSWHIQLTDLGLKKRDGESCTLRDMYRSLEHTHAVLGIGEEYQHDEFSDRASNDAKM